MDEEVRDEIIEDAERNARTDLMLEQHGNKLDDHEDRIAKLELHREVEEQLESRHHRRENILFILEIIIAVAVVYETYLFWTSTHAHG